MRKNTNVSELEIVPSEGPSERDIPRIAGPDARLREVRPRISGLDVTEPETDGSFGLEYPAGLEIGLEVPSPEIDRGARLASAAVGFMLTRIGMKKRTSLRMGMAAAGGALLAQAVSGKRIDRAVRR